MLTDGLDDANIRVAWNLRQHLESKCIRAVGALRAQQDSPVHVTKSSTEQSVPPAVKDEATAFVEAVQARHEMITRLWPIED